MDNSHQIFIEVISNLNKNSIEPIVYGSFGLYLLLKMNNESNDLDFIIDKPEQFTVCKKVLKKMGFEIDPDHDRELERNGFYVSFIDRSEIETLISEQLKIKKFSDNLGNYFNIDISQYKKIYSKGLENKYRKAKKEKEDLEKIRMIEKSQN
ncbi:MAG: hypothetical protein WCK48_02540 [bacterium]